MTTPTVTANDVRAHLISRGLLAADVDVEVSALTGGVSNDVLAVRGDGIDLVVKRALSQLRTAQSWYADTARLQTEGRALQLVSSILPEAVPAVVDLSSDYLVIRRAPHEWDTWKTSLLAGHVDPDVGATLGAVLGTVQAATTAPTSARPDLSIFADRQAFTQLRVDPFHRQIIVHHPDLGEAIEETITVMAASQDCLVHGDYTPKNVMHGASPDHVWVIDWEVAHLGDATFDPAWVTGHLLLKSLRRPSDQDALRDTAAAFLAAREQVSGAPELDHAQFMRQLGCLLVARVDGRSPVDYLDDASRVVARQLGQRALCEPLIPYDELWKDLS